MQKVDSLGDRTNLGSNFMSLKWPLFVAAEYFARAYWNQFLRALQWYVSCDMQASRYFIFGKILIIKSIN